MTFGLVTASFSLPEGQAVKMIFFARCGYVQYKYMYDVTEIVPTFWLVKTLQDGFLCM